MTKSQYSSLDAMLLGFQLIVFENIWPVFRWIESIWVKERNGQLQLFVETAAAQDEEEWGDLDYLVREMFEQKEKVLDKLEPGSKHKIEYTIQHGSSVPRNGGYRVLMSDKVFRKIAKEYAPPRLKLGR